MSDVDLAQMVDDARARNDDLWDALREKHQEVLRGQREVRRLRTRLAEIDARAKRTRLSRKARRAVLRRG